MPYGVEITKSGQFTTHRVRPTSGTEFIYSRHFPDEVQGDFLINNSIGFLGTKQHTIVEDGGILSNNKGLNLPGVAIRGSALTAKDQEDDIVKALEQGAGENTGARTDVGNGDVRGRARDFPNRRPSQICGVRRRGQPWYAGEGTA